MLLLRSIQLGSVSVVFSPDGTTLASGAGDRTVKLWDVTTRTSIATFWQTDVVSSVAFSPDRTLLASGTSAGTVELWDTSELMEIRRETVAEIDIPDSNLRAAIAKAVGLSPNSPITRGHLANLPGLEARNANITDLTGLKYATNLRSLDFGPDFGAGGLINSNSISDLSPLSRLTNLTSLILWQNSISDISPLANLTNLTHLDLGGNSISDISPLVTNAGLGSGDVVDVRGNPLNRASIKTHIPALQNREVTVVFDNRTPTRLLNISGVITASNNVLIVEVRDNNGRVFKGVPVTFTVTSGGGTLSVTSAITDEKGRAQSTLTLGPDGDTNIVRASVEGISESVTFSDVQANIPDSNLRAAIEEALGKTEGGADRSRGDGSIDPSSRHKRQH